MEILATNDGLRNLNYLRNLTQYIIKRSEMAVIEHAFFSFSFVIKLSYGIPSICDELNIIK